MRIVFTAVPREYLGNESKQENPHKDRHVGDKNGGLIHHVRPGPFSRGFLVTCECWVPHSANAGCPILNAPFAFRVGGFCAPFIAAFSP